MKHKILWLGVSFLLVAALVLASCGEAVPGQQEEEEEEEEPVGEQEEEEPVGEQEEEEEEEEEPVAGAPQYGGTFSHFTEWGHIDPAGFDPYTSTAQHSTTIWNNPFMEWLVKGDIETYGPRGNNEFGFNLMEYVPEQYLTGELAETWEITTDPLSMVFNLRHGVMWTGNDYMGMEPRELTADDVVFCLIRSWERPGRAASWEWIESITAPDRYTVVVALNEYNANWNWWFGGGFVSGGMYPPEVVEAGPDDWRNWCGSGPFIFTDYVEGSYLAYERNPNYWNTTVINGVEYQMPFVDKVIYPIIPDESTQIAALRTAKIDHWPRVPLVYEESLTKTSPDMIQFKWLSGRVVQFALNCLPDRVLNDTSLRRALMIGADLEAIRDAVYVEGDVLSFPLGRGVPAYTPMEELPASTQLLFDYNPDLAKQMMADAGYPDGFKLSLITTSKAEFIDISSMSAGMWEKIGIEVDIRVMEPAAAAAASTALDYDIAVGNYTVVAPFTILHTGLSERYRSSAGHDDPYYDEIYWEASAIMDPVARSAKTKIVAEYYLDNVMWLCWANGYNLAAYWPWVKNYYGELEAGYYDMSPMISRLWIDQDLKAEMGY